MDVPLRNNPVGTPEPRPLDSDYDTDPLVRALCMLNLLYAKPAWWRPAWAPSAGRDLFGRPLQPQEPCFVRKGRRGRRLFLSQESMVALSEALVGWGICQRPSLEGTLGAGERAELRRMGLRRWNELLNGLYGKESVDPWRWIEARKDHLDLFGSSIQAGERYLGRRAGVRDWSRVSAGQLRAFLRAAFDGNEALLAHGLAELRSRRENIRESMATLSQLIDQELGDLLGQDRQPG